MVVETGPVPTSSRLWHVHVTEYYRAMRRQELSLQTTVWVNLTDVVSRRSQSQRRLLCDPVHTKFENRQNSSTVLEVRILIVLGPGWVE